MSNLRDFAIRGGVILAIAVTLASCTENKASQCNKLSTTVNKIRPIAEKIQQEGKNFETAAKAAGAKNDLKAFKSAASTSASSFTGLIGQLDGLITEIKAIDLKDEKLVQLKERYVQNATSINTAFKDTSTALTSISKSDNSPKGLQDLQKAAGNLTQTASKMNSLVQEETKMVSDFNSYCEANK
jgi:Rad3-related DNA helicase